MTAATSTAIIVLPLLSESQGQAPSGSFRAVLLPRLANSSFQIWRECRVRDRAAEKIERLLERAVTLFVRRHT